MRRRLTIEIYKGKGKQPWRWRFLALNMRIMGGPQEGYSKKGNAVRAATRIRTMFESCSGVDVMDRDPVIGCWRKLA